MKTVKIGIIGGSGLYHMAGLTEHARSAREDAVWRSFGRDSDRNAGRAARGVSGAPRARPRVFAQRHQLPREYLRDEDARRGADYFGERGGLAARRFAADWIS